MSNQPDNAAPSWPMPIRLCRCCGMLLSHCTPVVNHICEACSSFEHSEAHFAVPITRKACSESGILESLAEWLRHAKSNEFAHAHFMPIASGYQTHRNEVLVADWRKV